MHIWWAQSQIPAGSEVISNERKIMIMLFYIVFIVFYGNRKPRVIEIMETSRTILIETAIRMAIVLVKVGKVETIVIVIEIEIEIEIVILRARVRVIVIVVVLVTLVLIVT